MKAKKKIELAPGQDRWYWEVVRRCLVQFHGFAPARAKTEAAVFRRDLIEAMSDPILLFHDDPFYMACDVADHDLDLLENREAYDRVLAEVEAILSAKEMAGRSA